MQVARCKVCVLVSALSTAPCCKCCYRSERFFVRGPRVEENGWRLNGTKLSPRKVVI